MNTQSYSSGRKKSKGGQSSLKIEPLKEIALNTVTYKPVLGNSMVVCVGAGTRIHAFTAFPGAYGMQEGSYVCSVNDLPSIIQSSDMLREHIEGRVRSEELKSFAEMENSPFEMKGDVVHYRGGSSRNDVRNANNVKLKADAKIVNAKHAEDLQTWQLLQKGGGKVPKKPPQPVKVELVSLLTPVQAAAEKAYSDHLKAVDRTPYLEEAEKHGYHVSTESGVQLTPIPGLNLKSGVELTSLQLRSSILHGDIFRSGELGSGGTDPGEVDMIVKAVMLDLSTTQAMFSQSARTSIKAAVRKALLGNTKESGGEETKGP